MIRVGRFAHYSLFLLLFFLWPLLSFSAAVRVERVTSCASYDEYEVRIEGFEPESLVGGGSVNLPSFLVHDLWIRERGEAEVPYVSVVFEVASYLGGQVYLLERETDTVRGVVLKASRGMRLRGRSGGYYPGGDVSGSVSESGPGIFFPSTDYDLHGVVHGAGGVLHQALHLYPVRYRRSDSLLVVDRLVRFRVMRGAGVVLPVHSWGAGESSPAWLPSSSRTVRSGEGRGGHAFSPLEGEGLLIVTRARFLGELERFIHWKRLRGLRVQVALYQDVQDGYVTLADTAGVKDYVVSQYDRDPGFRYLLLVGSRRLVPPLECLGVTGIADSDQAYGEVKGRDGYNEVYVGRFSADASSDVRTQVDRSLRYEHGADLPAGATARATLIASHDDGGEYADNGESDREHADVMAEVLESHGFDLVEKLYAESKPSDVKATTVAASFNSNRGLVTYTGHGTVYQWQTSGFGVETISQELRNTDFHPVIFSTACDVGIMNRNHPRAFRDEMCFAEKLLRASRGGKPVGAVGIPASSDEQWWEPPMAGQDAMVEYFAGARSPAPFTLGGVVTLGIARMLDRYANRYTYEKGWKSDLGYSTSRTWNLFGDPTLVVRGAQPALQIDGSGVPDRIEIGSSSLTVDFGVEGLVAHVALHRHGGGVEYHPASVLGTKYTFDLKELEYGDRVEILVWGLGYVTYHREVIPVINPDMAVAQLTDVALFHSDGLPVTEWVSDGEELKLSVSLKKQLEVPSSSRLELVYSVVDESAGLAKLEAVDGSDLRLDIGTFLTGMSVGETQKREQIFRIHSGRSGVVTLQVELQLDGAVLDRQTLSVEVGRCELSIGDAYLSDGAGSLGVSRLIRGGDPVELVVVVRNTGRVSSLAGLNELRVQWFGSDGVALPSASVQVEVLPVILGGGEVDRRFALVAPTGVGELVALRVELVEGIGGVRVLERVDLGVSLGHESDFAGRGLLVFPAREAGSHERYIRQWLSPHRVASSLEGSCSGSEGLTVTLLSFPVAVLGDTSSASWSIVRGALSQGETQPVDPGLPLEAVADRIEQLPQLTDPFLEGDRVYFTIPSVEIEAGRPVLVELYVRGSLLGVSAGALPVVTYDHRFDGSSAHYLGVGGSWGRCSASVSGSVGLSCAGSTVCRVRVVDGQSGVPVERAIVESDRDRRVTPSSGEVGVEIGPGRRLVRVDSDFHEGRELWVVNGPGSPLHILDVSLVLVGEQEFRLYVSGGAPRRLGDVSVIVGGVSASKVSEGVWSVMLLPGEYRVEVTTLGYKRFEDQVRVTKFPDRNRLDVQLVPDMATPSGGEGTVDPPVGLGAEKEGLLSVYPNPASGSFCLDNWVGFPVHYELLGLSDLSVLRGLAPVGRTVVDLSGVSSGLYVLRVWGGGGEPFCHAYRLIVR